MSLCREIHVALPDSADDLYRQHQLVWEAVRNKLVLPGQGSFVYAMLSPRVAVVRSHRFDRGPPSRLTERPLCLTLVSAVQEPGTGRLRALYGEEAVSKISSLLAKHGFGVEDLVVEQQTEQVGKKVRADMRIAIPTSVVRFTPKVQNLALADHAWSNGIGRGKRFGCGMLRVA